MDIRPDTANLETNDSIKIVDPSKVKIGDIIVVKPGEKIPLDGEIIQGISQLDTKALTGEFLTKEVTILPKAPPIITPTAISTTLPFIANSLNSFINVFII